MSSWTVVVKNSLVTGKLAGAATTAAAAVCGAIEGVGAVSPLNAVSHILWGENEAIGDEVSARHTLLGVALNVLATTSWALLFEAAIGDRGEDNPMLSLVCGALVSGVAYCTDYHLVPRRWTPGFEKKLSQRSLIVIYTALAMALAVGPISRARER